MITEQQVEAAYQIASQVFRAQLSSNSGVTLLSRDFGLNETSAKIFIDDYKHLMTGNVFKRTLSAYAMNYFIENIGADHGRQALANAVKSLRSHITYYEGHYKVTLHAQRATLAKYEARP